MGCLFFTALARDAIWHDKAPGGVDVGEIGHGAARSAHIMYINVRDNFDSTTGRCYLVKRLLHSKTTG